MDQGFRRGFDATAAYSWIRILQLQMSAAPILQKSAGAAFIPFRIAASPLEP
jgi:hypothetical protein